MLGFRSSSLQHPVFPCRFCLQDFLAIVIRLLESTNVVVRAKAFLAIQQLASNSNEMLLAACENRYAECCSWSREIRKRTFSPHRVIRMFLGVTILFHRTVVATYTYTTKKLYWTNNKELNYLKLFKISTLKGSMMTVIYWRDWLLIHKVTHNGSCFGLGHGPQVLSQPPTFVVTWIVTFRKLKLSHNIKICTVI